MYVPDSLCALWSSLDQVVVWAQKSTATGVLLTWHFSLIWQMWRNRDKIATYIVLPSLLSNSSQMTLDGEICITKGLSWHTLARVIVRAPVSHTARWPKTSDRQLCSGGYGKSLGVGGKMPPISLCGLQKNAGYSVRSDQRAFSKQPSVDIHRPEQSAS